MNSRPRKVAALYLGVVFAAGAVFGVASYRFYAVNVAQADLQLTPQEYRRQVVSKLEHELNLTPQQNAQVVEIYDYIGERWHDVRDAMEPEFEAMRKERADRILAILDAEQQTKYRAILEEKRLKHEAARAKGVCY